MKKTMSPRGAALLILSLGIIALIFGITSIVKHNKYVPVEATITEIQSEYDTTENQYRYRTFVRYFIDGKKYDEELGYHEDGFEEGKTIEIRYNPANPSQIIESSMGFTIYLTVLGPILILLGVFLFLKNKR